MDIHKPKAAHSLREFAIEIGTIICGILIALSLEQGVEWLHERHVAAEARENLRDEVGRNLDFLDRRAAIQGCIDQRLDALQALVVAASGGAPTPRPLWVGRPQIWDLTEAQFQATSSGGRAALLTPYEQSRFAALYGTFRAMRDAEQVEQTAWAHLRVLEVAPRIDPAQADALLAAVEEARYANFRIKVAMNAAHILAKTHGFRAVTEGQPPQGSLSVCVPLSTLRADALAQISAKAGRTWVAEP